MTIGEALSILEQFPKEKTFEIGLLSKEDNGAITVLPVADILLSEKHILLVDEETSKLVQEIIGGKLNLRKAKPGEEIDSVVEDNEVAS
jgi:hypothetical protein